MGRLWYYRFTDADGKKWERKGCTDRRVTEELARAAEIDAPAPGRFEADPKAERMAREARRPIAEHVAEFIAGLEVEGERPEACSFDRDLHRPRHQAGRDRADWRPDTLQRLPGRCRAQSRWTLSARAVNAYLTAIKSFSRWLKRDGRTA